MKKYIKIMQQMRAGGNPFRHKKKKSWTPKQLAKRIKKTGEKVVLVKPDSP